MTSENTRPLSVSELNNYIKQIVSNDDMLSSLFVEGEISNLKFSSSGHIYFSLKDQTSVIRAVMFRSRAMTVKFRLEDGMKVNVFGFVDVYEHDGTYQLYCQSIEPAGLGALYARFEALKKALAMEGLFDEAHKKKIPMLPKCIGVVTSPTGAVIQDIHNVAGRRFKEIPIVLYPAQVQGREAAITIVSAIKQAILENKCDVLIVARGGGSLEDLWPFNEEIVARAIYDCPIPVISAVGHETDFTIADFAADLRAPTPSAAAELAVPEKNALIETITKLKQRLESAPMSLLNDKRRELGRLSSSYIMKHPETILDGRRKRLERAALLLDGDAEKFSSKKKNELAAISFRLKSKSPSQVVDMEKKNLMILKNSMIASSKKELAAKQSSISLLNAKLSGLSPLGVLDRGYSLVTDTEGNVLTSEKQVKKGSKLKVRMKDGSFDAERI